ncbi:MAG: hypothetical protein LBR93_01105 [Treponema sp.]|jgi:hypothetical protein|nr:hypothetical protein [Treponema sp.]
MKHDDYIKWHPAFFQAIRLELADYRDTLRFLPEYQLTAEPLRIDVLIVKKTGNLQIAKNIARVFRAVNIWEFKSPSDSFSVKDFLKVYSYACLYAAITPEGDMADITLSFAGARYPRELIKYLRDVRKYRIEETEPGIYEVKGDYLPIQIIVGKELSLKENLWLKGLRKDLERSEVESIVREGRKPGRGIAADAYLDAVFHGNTETFREVIQMGKRKVTFEEMLMEEGILPKWIEKGREEGREMVARNLLNRGMSVKETAEAAELSVKKVRSLSASIRKKDKQKQLSGV